MFSRPWTFNDPSDCDIRLQFKEGNVESINQYIVEVGVVPVTQDRPQINPHGSLLWQIVNWYEGTTEEKRADFNQIYAPEGSTTYNCLQEVISKGVLSLSKIPNNPLMWAHYAGKHTGYCFEYEIENDSDLIEVSYSTKRPTKIPFFAKGTFDPDFGQRLMLDQFSTKSSDWAYEKEVRILRPFGVHKVGSLTGIYIGLRAFHGNPKAYGTISDLADADKPPVYKNNGLGSLYEFRFSQIMKTNKFS